MRHYMVEQPGEGMTERLETELKPIYYRTTERYIEFEQSVGEAYLVWYLIPTGTKSFFFATCWKNLEELFYSLREGKIHINDFFHKWPLMNKLISNGSSKKYDEYALIRDRDLDTGEPTWFVLSIVENQKIESIYDIFDGLSRQSMQRVIRTSGNLYHEITTVTPSFTGVFMRTLARDAMNMDLFLGFAGVFLDPKLQKSLEYMSKAISSGLDAYKWYNKIQGTTKGEEKIKAEYLGRSFQITHVIADELAKQVNQLNEYKSDEKLESLLLKLGEINIYIRAKEGGDAVVMWQLMSSGHVNHLRFNTYSCEEYYKMLQLVFDPIYFSYNEFCERYYRKPGNY